MNCHPEYIAGDPCCGVWSLSLKSLRQVEGLQGRVPPVIAVGATDQKLVEDQSAFPNDVKQPGSCAP